MKNSTLSVIMPALNEEKNIEGAIFSTIYALEKHGIEGEIIVINDGSTDNTETLVNQIILEHSHVKLINHSKPCGIGYSFFDGVKNSKNDVVVMFPGDNENNPDDALIFFYLMKNVDIIVPFISNIQVRSEFRRSLSALFRFIINLSFGINLNYTNGTVFYNRAVLNEIDIKSFGFLYQAEALIKLVKKGYLYAEVPNLLSKRTHGKSKALSLKSLINIVHSYIKLFWEINILKTAKRLEEKDFCINSATKRRLGEKHD